MQRAKEKEELLRLVCSLCRPLTAEPAPIMPRLRPLKKIKAVLFDVYGTLLISSCGDVGTELKGGAPSEAFSRALELSRLGLSFEESLADRVGKLLEEQIGAFHEKVRARGISFPEVDILRVWKEVLRILDPELDVTYKALLKFALAYECLVNPVWPMPSSLEVIKELKGRGLLLGIVSNAQFYTPILLEALMGSSLREAGFEPDLCFWSYLFLEAKPSVDLFRPALFALKRRGVGPHETLFVGNDLRKDIRPAESLSFRTALFAGDARSYRAPENEAGQVTPTVVITGLSQLVELLE